MGTLDTQDYILRNMTDGDGPAFGDFRRGQDLCDLGAKWGIKGFMRMEIGFKSFSASSVMG
jgi:hypothetical protein